MKRKPNVAEDPRQVKYAEYRRAYYNACKKAGLLPHGPAPWPESEIQSEETDERMALDG
jgi:hypothetical protein